MSTNNLIAPAVFVGVAIVLAGVAVGRMEVNKFESEMKTCVSFMKYVDATKYQNDEEVREAYEQRECFKSISKH